MVSRRSSHCGSDARNTGNQGSAWQTRRLHRAERFEDAGRLIDLHRAESGQGHAGFVDDIRVVVTALHIVELQFRIV